MFADRRWKRALVTLLLGSLNQHCAVTSHLIDHAPNHAQQLHTLPSCFTETTPKSEISREPSARTADAVLDIAQAWFQLGNRYVEQHCWAAAIESYQQALKYHPHPQALHNLGLTHVQLGMEALHQAYQQLPAQDAVHSQTREYLKLLLETF